MDIAIRVLKNIGMMLVSQVTINVVNLFYTIIVARYLGAEGFGVLSFAIALAGVFSIVSDLGLKKIIVRDFARVKEQIYLLFGKFLFAKIVLNLLAFVCISIFVNLFDYPVDTRRVVYIISCATLLATINDSFYAVFQSRNVIKYESIGRVFRALILLLVSSVLVARGCGIILISYVYLFASIVLFFYCFFLYIKNFGLPVLSIDIKFIYDRLRESICFALVSFFEVIYHWMDTVMLSLMKGDHAVGYYNAAYKIFLVTLFIPTVFNLVIYPVMSKAFVDDENLLKKIYEKYFKYLTIVGVFICVSISLFAPQIIILVFGDSYEPSITALRILIWSALFIFVNSAFVRLFEAIDMQSVITKICAVAAVINIILNISLIPTYGIYGAGVATIISEFYITLMVILKSQSTSYRLEWGTILGYLTKILVPASLLWIVVARLFFETSVFFVFPVFTGSFFLLLFITKSYEYEDFCFLKRLVACKVEKFNRN